MTAKKEIKVSAFRFYGQEIFYHALTGMVLPNTFQGTCAIYFPGCPLTTSKQCTMIRYTKRKGLK